MLCLSWREVILLEKKSFRKTLFFILWIETISLLLCFIGLLISFIYVLILKPPSHFLIGSRKSWLIFLKSCLTEAVESVFSDILFRHRSSLRRRLFSSIIHHHCFPNVFDNGRCWPPCLQLLIFPTVKNFPSKEQIRRNWGWLVVWDLITHCTVFVKAHSSTLTVNRLKSDKIDLNRA